MAKITIEVDLTEEEELLLKSLLMDAFWEFKNRRVGGSSSASNYVDRRYPLPTHSDIYGSAPSHVSGLSRREEKIRQVELRCGLAEKLHKSIFTKCKVEK